MRTPLLVASDVHLSAGDPAGIGRLVEFLRGPAAGAASLVLAGDLFDAWVTPAQAAEPAFRPVFEALRRLADAEVEVGFVEGNRDFEAGSALGDVGVRRLPDTFVVDAPGLRAVVTHGDLLCRGDVRYQAFRRFVRSETFRHLFRATPPRLAVAAGDAARAGSRLETARKAYGTMGLDGAAVADLFRRTGADVLVCGHVHWGRRHSLEVDGLRRDVIVLGAWDAGDATYARLGPGRATFHRWTPPGIETAGGAAPRETLPGGPAEG